RHARLLAGRTARCTRTTRRTARSRRTAWSDRPRPGRIFARATARTRRTRSHRSDAGPKAEPNAGTTNAGPNAGPNARARAPNAQSRRPERARAAGARIEGAWDDRSSAQRTAPVIQPRTDGPGIPRAAWIWSR